MAKSSQLAFLWCQLGFEWFSWNEPSSIGLACIRLFNDRDQRDILFQAWRVLRPCIQKWIFCFYYCECWIFLLNTTRGQNLSCSFLKRWFHILRFTSSMRIISCSWSKPEKFLLLKYSKRRIWSIRIQRKIILEFIIVHTCPFFILTKITCSF